MTILIPHDIEQPNVGVTGAERGDIYELMNNYNVTFDMHDERIFFTIPAGFTYDGASVPRILWSISGLTPDGAHRIAALIHDYIYERKGIIKEYMLTRGEADLVFKAYMKKAGISNWRVNIAYWSVRLFGQDVWKSSW